MIYVVADLARKRRGRGLKLNVAEATALIAEALLEGTRHSFTAAGCSAARRCWAASTFLGIRSTPSAGARESTSATTRR